MPPTFNGLRVLTLESRRATEITTLVSTFGGVPMSAPALREVALDSNAEALQFAQQLIGGGVDVVVALTGVGLRTLLDVVDRFGDRPAFVAALARVRVAARGPKPVAVLRELGVTPWVTAPEPNTWRELLAALDARGPDVLRGARVAVQEYGRSNPGLLAALRERGATVTAVPVYHYGLPDDAGPLDRAVDAIIGGTVDVVLFTTSIQAAHLFEIAARDGRDAALRDAFQRVAVASIGPTTSEELREHGLTVDLEPSHPKMGILVREAADRAGVIVAGKRRRGQ